MVSEMDYKIVSTGIFKDIVSLRFSPGRPHSGRPHSGTPRRHAQAGHAQAGHAQAGHAQASHAQAGHVHTGHAQAGQPNNNGILIPKLFLPTVGKKLF